MKKLNNSDIKHLINRKGFRYGNSPKGNMVAVIVPEGPAKWVTNGVIEWLEQLPDVVIPKDNRGKPTSYPGYHVGDRVQVFTTMNDYLYWGRVGRITKVFTDDSFEKPIRSILWAVVQITDNGFVTLPANESTVIERDGVVSLAGMSAEERDAVIASMMTTAKAKKILKESNTYCECGNDACKILLNEEQWQELDDLRTDETAEYQMILSKKCWSVSQIHPDNIIGSTDDLLLIDISR